LKWKNSSRSSLPTGNSIGTMYDVMLEKKRRYIPGLTFLNSCLSKNLCNKERQDLLKTLVSNFYI